MTRRAPKPSKTQLVQMLLQKGSVFVHFDPRKSSVRVPSYLKDQNTCNFQFGYDLPVPIHDLAVSLHGIGGTLSFRQIPHPVFVPWAAVYAVVGEDGMGMPWTEDFPPELRGLADDIAKSVPPIADLCGDSIVANVTSLDAYRAKRKKDK